MSRPTISGTRITIIFSDDQMLWLQAESRRRSITISDLIRRVLDEVRGEYIVDPATSDQYRQRNSARRNRYDDIK